MPPTTEKEKDRHVRRIHNQSVSGRVKPRFATSVATSKRRWFFVSRLGVPVPLVAIANRVPRRQLGAEKSQEGMKNRLHALSNSGNASEVGRHNNEEKGGEASEMEKKRRSSRRRKNYMIIGLGLCHAPRITELAAVVGMVIPGTAVLVRTCCLRGEQSLLVMSGAAGCYTTSTSLYYTRLRYAVLDYSTSV